MTTRMQLKTGMLARMDPSKHSHTNINFQGDFNTMSILEQDLPVIETSEDPSFEEQEMYRLQQLNPAELEEYQEMLEEGYENEDAFQKILDAREPEPEPIESQIKTKVTLVHYLRQTVEAEQQAYNAALAKLNEQYAAQITSLANHKKDLLAAESALKDLALLQFDGKNKKPFPGTGIRVSNKITVIYDDSKALEWAKQKDICLQLDTKAFEEICKTASKPDFVQCVESELTSATIDSDLSKALSALDIAKNEAS